MANRTYRRAGNLHICGDSHPLWDDMAELGFSSVSLDNAMDLAEAKMVMGNKVALKGNVKPVETMLYGTAEEVLQASRECIENALITPGVYLKQWLYSAGKYSYRERGSYGKCSAVMGQAKKLRG